VTQRLIEWSGRQNVQYAKSSLRGVVLWKSNPWTRVLRRWRAAAEEAEARTGVRVSGSSMPPAIRDRHVREVLTGPPLSPEGCGLPASAATKRAARQTFFPDILSRARDLGLHRVAHAGEACGPESILGRRRVAGRGAHRPWLTAIRDANVMALLRERRIPVRSAPAATCPPA